MFRASSKFLYTVLTHVLLRHVHTKVHDARSLRHLFEGLVRRPTQFAFIHSIVVHTVGDGHPALPAVVAAFTEIMLSATRIKHAYLGNLERSLQCSPQLRRALLIHPSLTSVHVDVLGPHCVHLLQERNSLQCVTVDGSTSAPEQLSVALARSAGTLRELRISHMSPLFVTDHPVWSHLVYLSLHDVPVSIATVAHNFPNIRHLTLLPLEPTPASLSAHIALPLLTHLTTSDTALVLLRLSGPIAHIILLITDPLALQSSERLQGIVDALNILTPSSLRVQGNGFPHRHVFRTLRGVPTLRILDFDIRVTVEDADDDGCASAFLVSNRSARGSLRMNSHQLDSTT